MSRPARVVTQMLVAGAVGGIVGGALAQRYREHSLRALLNFSPGMLAAIALIVLFSVYWSIASKSSAPALSSESRLSRQIHVIALNLSVLVLILPVPGLARRFLPAGLLLQAIGLVLETAGILFAIWARRHLGANWSGEVRVATGHQLIRSGPYARIRHPIYTGVLAMYAGTMLVSGELHALLAVAIITLLYLRKLGQEEKILSTAFGPDYAVYRRDSWALIPPLF
jgi:protein-S-isoprenylcysteine O-methyltransferase Ste14